MTSTPYVVVCNADVQFLERAVEEMIDALELDATLAAAGPAVLDAHRARQASARRLPGVGTAIMHAILGRIVPSNRWSARYRADDMTDDHPRDADWLSGCAIALRREAFDQIGGFDPAYFLYVEDVDLGVRLRAAGWRLRYLPAAQVVHRGAASTAQRPVRSLVAHARSLDIFVSRRYLHGPMRVLRPLLWPGLAAWVALGTLKHTARPHAAASSDRQVHDE